MYHLAIKVAEFEANDKKYRREGTAEALRLKKPAITDVEDFYPTFQDMVKNLLDGKKIFIATKCFLDYFAWLFLSEVTF